MATYSGNNRSRQRGIAGSVISLLVLGLSGLAPAQQPGVSVQSGNHEVSMTVTNMTQIQVVAVWVDFEGKQESYANLAPGQSMEFQTYPGHLWRFGSGNQTLGEYRATAAAQQGYRVAAAAAAARPAQARGGGRRAPVNPIQPGTVPVNPTPARAAPVGPNPGKPAMTRNPGTPVGAPVVQNPRPNPVVQDNPPAAAAGGSKVTAAEVQQLVGFHNQVRQEVGVGAVAWDPTIAAFAQQWADHIARTGNFDHRPADQQRYGENLAANSDVLAGARMWYGEKSLYRPGTTFDGSMMNAAHYTQMVWRGSTRIGAGKAVIATGKWKGLTVLVCNYSPAGNMVGQKPY